MDSLQFLFESNVYKIDEEMYKNTQSTRWVEDVLVVCKESAIPSWNINALVAIAQFGKQEQTREAVSFLLKYVEHYSEE